MIKRTENEFVHNGFEIRQTTTTFAGWEGQGLLVRIFIFLTKNMQMLGGLTEGIFTEGEKKEKIGVGTLKKMFAKKIDLEEIIGIFLKNFDQADLKKLINDLLQKTEIEFLTEDGAPLSEEEYPQTLFTLGNKKEFDNAFAGELSLLVPVINQVMSVNYKDFLGLWGSWGKNSNLTEDE